MVSGSSDSTKVETWYWGAAVVVHHVVLGAITQTHKDGVSAAVGNYGFLGGGDLGRDRITQVGEEDALPSRGSCAGADILHVQAHSS